MTHTHTHTHAHAVVIRGPVLFTEHNFSRPCSRKSPRGGPRPAVSAPPRDAGCVLELPGQREPSNLSLQRCALPGFLCAPFQREMPQARSVPYLQGTVGWCTANPEKLAVLFPIGCREEGRDHPVRGHIQHLKKNFPLLEWLTFNSLL